MKHLSDQDIQKYLDNDPELNRTEIEMHLNQCGSCRRNYQLYQQLYQGLGDETGFMLSADFAESVVSKVRKRKERAYSFFEGMLLAISGVVAVGLMVHFTNIGDLFIEIFSNSARQFEPIVGGIRDLLGGNLIIFLFAIIIIILFGLADKLIFQMKHR